MISLDLVVSSVAATTLALLISGSSKLTARFRHGVLLMAIVVVPAGTLAVGTLLPHASDYGGFTGLRVALDEFASQLPGKPTLVATDNVTRTIPFQQAYAVVALLLLLRMTWGVLSTSQRVRKAREINFSRLGGTKADPGLSIRKSNQAGSPFTWGLIRPTIVVPHDWDDWPRGKRLAVTLHECAHIRRGDVTTAILSLLACCLLWINPMIWVAHRRLRQEAERACDDDVIACGIEASRYAGYLVEIARSASSTAAPAMAAPSTLSRRVTALLDPHTRRFDMPRKYTWITIAAAFAVMSGSAALGVSSTPEGNQSAVTKLRDCGKLLPPDSRFVMELSADWNTKTNPSPEEAFRLSFTFGDKNRPDLVGEIPDELHGFAGCLSKALTHEELEEWEPEA